MSYHEFRTRIEELKTFVVVVVVVVITSIFTFITLYSTACLLLCMGSLLVPHNPTHKKDRSFGFHN
jgi:hypothetical protein